MNHVEYVGVTDGVEMHHIKHVDKIKSKKSKDFCLFKYNIYDKYGYFSKRFYKVDVND